jgi:hypothetical protein
LPQKLEPGFATECPLIELRVQILEERLRTDDCQLIDSIGPKLAVVRVEHAVVHRQG